MLWILGLPIFEWFVISVWAQSERILEFVASTQKYAV